MHRLVPVLILALAAFATSCGSSDPVFVNGQWQVRCPEDLAGCPTDGPSHMVAGFADEEAVDFVSCSVEKLDGSQRLFRFEVREGESRAVGRNIVFDEESGAVSMCEFRAIDGAEYSTEGGGCGGGTPTPGVQPCQMQVEIDRNKDLPRPKITARVECRGITAAADPTTFIRDVTLPTDRDAPARFDFDGCDGDVL